MDHPDESPLLEVGRITRAHGLRGEVLVELLSDREERRRPGARFEGPDGPLVLRSARPHQRRWLVTFEGVHDRTTAEALRGAVLRAPALPSEDDDEVWVHEVVGRHVIDEAGVDRGAVVALEANPAADLLVLDTGHLVPLTFVTEVGEVVRVEAPPGLFEL